MRHLKRVARRVVKRHTCEVCGQKTRVRLCRRHRQELQALTRAAVRLLSVRN